jgi:hypothetical protein
MNIIILYPAGAYGSTLEYLVRKSLGDEIVFLKNSTDGTMHSFEKHFHPRTLEEISQIPDFLQNSNNKINVIAPAAGAGHRLQAVSDLVSSIHGPKIAVTYANTPESLLFASVNRLLKVPMPPGLELDIFNNWMFERFAPTVDKTQFQFEDHIKHCAKTYCSWLSKTMKGIENVTSGSEWHTLFDTDILKGTGVLQTVIHSLGGNSDVLSDPVYLEWVLAQDKFINLHINLVDMLGNDTISLSKIKELANTDQEFNLLAVAATSYFIWMNKEIIFVD